MLKNEFPRIPGALECVLAVNILCQCFFSSLYSLSLLLVLVKNVTEKERKKEFPIKSQFLIARVLSGVWVYGNW